MTDEQIITFLEHLIFEKHKTQTEIAEEVGVSRPVVLNLLHRKQSIKTITRMKFERYAKKLGYIKS